MQYKVLFRKSVCSLFAFLIGWTQTGIAVAQMESIGKDANAFGREMADQFKNTQPTWDGANINIRAGNSNYSVGKDTLVPKADGKNIKYSSSEADFQAQQGMWNNSDQMDEVGARQKDSLFKDAQNDDPTVEGSVYKLLVDMAQNPPKDLSRDSAFQKSQDILDNIKAEIENIVSCKKDQSLASSGEYKHVTDLQTCQQVLDRSQTCTITHKYSNGAIEYYSGPYNVDACKNGDPNCTEMWLGIVGNNYIPGGSCTLHEEEILVKVLNPRLITKAVLWYAAYDDQMQIWIGPQGREKKVYQGPLDTFPYEDYSATRVPGIGCELDHHWIWDPTRTGYGCTESDCGYVQDNLQAIDITNHITSAGKNGIVRFHLRDAIGGYGEAYASVRVYYDPSRIKEEAEEYTPANCIEAYNGMVDNMAHGQLTCTKMPGNIDSEGCVVTNGIKICSDMLGTPPINLDKFGIDKLCQKIEVKANFDFYQGDTGCWKALVGFDDKGNAQYEEVCGGYNGGGNLDTCSNLVDKGCRFVESKCTYGMTGESGTCYVNDVTYDCGTDVRVGNDSMITNYDCKGISCVGDSCIDVEHGVNVNFGKVSAILQMADYASEDMQCTGLDEDGHIKGDENVTCTVFGGTSGSCKIAVGGWQDCCDSPQSAGLKAYISMTMSAKGAHQATANLTTYANDWKLAASSANATVLPQGAQTVWNIGSQYTQAIGPVSDVLSQGTSYLGKAVSSVFDSVKGIYDQASKLVDDLIKEVFGNLIDEIKRYLSELLAKILEKTGLAGVINGGAAAGGTTAGAVAAEGLATYAAAAFAVVSWVYLAYQVANLIVMLVYKCEEAEYELDAKRDAKNCHFVGSYCKDKVLGMCILKKKVYCCFQSALSRIVNEQIRATQPEVMEYGGAGGWGTPKNPVCDGIPIEKIDKINWDLIDLSEWEGMVVSTDNIAQKGDDVTMEMLTGKGNTHLNMYGTGKKDGAKASRMMVAPRGGKTPASGYRFPNSTERENVLVRNEQALVGQDVDKLRFESRKCFSIYLGGGTHYGSDCKDVSTDSIVCRKDGHIVSCDEIAKDNMLNDLLNGEGGKTNQDWADEGKRCFDKNGNSVDCTTIWDDALIKDVLDDYAATIGGTTKDGKYVCTDKSGTYSDKICEAAIRANTCHCSAMPGDFVCRNINQIIDCKDLGTDDSMTCPTSCEGYVCESDNETVKPEPDPEEPPKEGISDWIVDLEPTCSTPGSKHKEDLATGEVVETKPLIKICTEEEIQKENNNATKVGATLSPSVTNADGTDWYGFASYVDADGTRRDYGTVGGSAGIIALQCADGKGCQVGIDTTVYPKFIDAVDKDIYVTVNGKDYNLVQANGRYSYWTGENGNKNGSGYSDDTSDRICSVDPELLKVIKDTQEKGLQLTFTVSIRTPEPETPAQP